MKSKLVTNTFVSLITVMLFTGASVEAKIFFSIPGPIFGLISFAWTNVNFGTTSSSIKSPSTFVMNNTLSLPTLPATYAAALSPSTLRNSDSSLIAIGEITGVSPCLSNDLMNSEFTFLIV